MSIYCPQCGAPAAEGVRKCEYCGASIPQPEQPVQNTQPAQNPQPAYNTQPAQDYRSPNANLERSNWPIKSKIVAGILAILLGSIGIHKFYLGQTGKGILYLLFCWTYIPSIVGVIEGIIILCSNDENFQIKYKCRLG